MYDVALPWSTSLLAAILPPKLVSGFIRPLQIAEARRREEERTAAQGSQRIAEEERRIVAEEQRRSEERVAIEQAQRIAEGRQRLRPVSSGSGFAISELGYIVTNNHVIEGCNEVKVQSQGSQFNAAVITVDEINDLAVLKVDFNPLNVFTLAEDSARVLDEIYVAGYPFGEALSSSIKITGGRVNSLSGIGNNSSEIQFDAVIQPGNSGGPVFNDQGNVIAVAVSSLNAQYYLDRFGVIPQNTNFGVKANVLRNLLESNNIATTPPKSDELPSQTLSTLATNATFYLSCWMTAGRMEEMQSRKVMFTEIGR